MYTFFKRAFDICSASLLLLVISPIFLILTILVRINLGSPVFFRQERTTKGAKPFYIMKFRTMSEKKDENGNYLPDEMRQTKFGNFLRSSSLDELPELINIIKGDMSVIGPRPLPMIYNDYYTKDEFERFDVRAGLIPPEVLYGTVFPTWDEQLGYEADYARNLSFALDIKIMISVFKVLLKRFGSDFGEYIREPLNVERTEKRSDIICQ